MPALALRFDEPAFRDGIAKYIVTTCSRYGVRRSEVADVKQEVFATIFANLRLFCPERGDFDAWARGVALNVIRNHARDAKRYHARFSEYFPNVDDHAAPEPSPERYAQRAEARSSIVEASTCLTEQQTQIVVLHVVYDLPHRHIANELGISAAASQKRFQRACDHLSKCLPEDLLSMVPLVVSSCNDTTITKERRSRWSERSHYVVQVATLIMAVVLSFSMRSTTLHEPAKDQTAAQGSMPNSAMCDSDKQAGVQDEPTVHRDAPTVKPEPASLPSVRDVSSPTRLVDKPIPTWQPSPLPPYKPKPSSSDHWHLGR